jgi:type II secretory pathway pseudopilin PulG
MAINPKRWRKSPQRGFTILEALIASVVLAVGMIGLLGFFVASIANIQNSQEELLARQKARETLESIYAARNSQQITFDGINNVVNGGIFLDGPQPLRDAGNDGIFGTVDDGNIQTVVLPGQDGVLGTADDTTRTLSEFQREIKITPLNRSDGTFNPDLREIIVTVSYNTPAGLRSYSTAGYVSRFR